jgi:hypothetical protein
MSGGRGMSSLRVVGLLGVAVMVALAATTAASASAQLTKPRYIAKADAICTAADAKVSKLGALVPASRSVAVGGKVVAIDRAALAALRGLTPPASERVAVAKLLELADAAINTGIARVVSAAKSGSASAFASAVRRAQMLVDRAHAAARSFGLYECASW